MAILLFQRSFRSFLKYRTIVLYLFFPLTRFIQSFIRSLVNRSSFSSPHPCRAQLLFIVCIIIHLAFIYSSFPRPSRDHPERHCRVPIPFILSPFLFYSVPLACSFFHSSITHPFIQSFIQSFIRSLVNRSSFSSPLPYRAQLLFIFVLFIYLFFRHLLPS